MFQSIDGFFHLADQSLLVEALWGLHVYLAIKKAELEGACDIHLVEFLVS